MTRQPSKAVVMTPKKSTSGLAGISTINILKSLPGDVYDMTVIQKTGSESLSSIRNKIPDNSTEIEVYYCYTDDSG